MEHDRSIISMPRPWPKPQLRQGQYIRLEPLDASLHGESLFACSHGNEVAERIWDYLPYGPFENAGGLIAWLQTAASKPDPQFYAIVDIKSGEACGVCSFLRMEPASGVIEVGHIWFAPHLQRSAAATEAMFLLFKYVFEDLQYRRLEWKCNALNAKSRTAAERLGFAYEGTFRQHLIVKGRNRDSAWFSLLDHEWEAVGSGMRRWLRPENFRQPHGDQVQRLNECINSR